MNIVFLSLRALPSDPLLWKQFGLNSDGTNGTQIGEDIRVFPVWDEHETNASETTFGIIGRGCYVDHRDLANQMQELHYSVDDGTDDVRPILEDKVPGYATGLLGIAIGKANDVCTVGVSHNSPFYCIKTTKQTEEDLIKAIKYRNNETQIKIIATPHNTTEIKDSGFVRFHAPLYNSELDNVFAEESTQNTVFVAFAGSDSKSGSDTNFFPEIKDPRVISVADSTPLGGRSHWSSRGSSLVVNAPAGGSSSSKGINVMKPNPPTIGITADDACVEDGFTPMGVGSAHVAGVLGLLFDENFDLNSRETQYILILSSQKNDPKHKSWQTNAAGFNYSNVYGFGRVDASRAMSVSDQQLILPRLKNASADFGDLHLHARGSFSNVTANVKGNISFVEYITLQFEADSVQYLYLEIISPSGTIAKVSYPSLVLDEKGNYQYVVRQFFGEKTDGPWMVRATYEGYGHKQNIIGINIHFYGCEETPILPMLTYKEGYDSQSPYQNGASFLISQSPNLQCGEKFELTITTPGVFDVFIYDSISSTRFQIGSDIQSGLETPFSYPCHLASKNASIYVEQRHNKIGGIVPFTVRNPHNTSYVVSPLPYDVFNVSQNNEVEIPFSLSYLSQYLTDDAESHNMIVGLYDIKNNKTIQQTAVDIASSNVKFADINQSYPESILYFVPLSRDKFDGCDTLIQPISLFVPKDSPKKTEFSVPLSNQCPVPPGVKIIPDDEPQPETIPANLTLRIVYACIFIGLCVFLVIGITAWNFLCRLDEKKMGFESVALLTHE